MADVWAYLQIVEVLFVDVGRYERPPGVPRSLEVRVMLMDIGRETVDGGRVAVATHEADACDGGAPVGTDEHIQSIGCQLMTDILPEICAVAARTAAWTTGDVYRQRCLVWNLLEDNVCIDVF